VSDVRESGPGETDIESVQLLTPEGERVEHPDYAFTGDDEMIRGFYAQMALVRRVDAEAIALQRQGELGLWPSSLGQEGAQIGAAYALRSQDFVFPTYREHGVTITRGVDPLRVLAMYRGCETGTWDVFDHKTYMSSIIIGSQGVQAAGYGMGLERDGLVGSGDPERDAAVVCFFGDGASSQGDINEGLIFAAR
jgi:2-oxoisovalerate dehydrogenase E1 component alpha subunit